MAAASWSCQHTSKHLSRRNIRRAQVSLAAVHWRSVETLLGLTESCEMLDLGRHVQALNALGVVVADFACEIRVL